MTKILEALAEVKKIYRDTDTICLGEMTAESEDDLRNTLKTFDAVTLSALAKIIQGKCLRKSTPGSTYTVTPLLVDLLTTPLQIPVIGMTAGFISATKNKSIKDTLIDYSIKYTNEMISLKHMTAYARANNHKKMVYSTCEHKLSSITRHIKDINKSLNTLHLDSDKVDGISNALERLVSSIKNAIDSASSDTPGIQILPALEKSILKIENEIYQLYESADIPSLILESDDRTALRNMAQAKQCILDSFAKLKPLLDDLRPLRSSLVQPSCQAHELKCNTQIVNNVHELRKLQKKIDKMSHGRANNAANKISSLQESINSLIDKIRELEVERDNIKAARPPLHEQLSIQAYTDFTEDYDPDNKNPPITKSTNSKRS